MSSREGAPEKSLGALARELSEDLSTLVRSEIALAKLELKQTAVALGATSAFFALALLCALCGTVFIFVTIVLALALVVPAWLSALIVAVVLFAAAAGLGLLAWKKVRTVKFLPEETIGQVKTDIASIRSGLSTATETTSWPPKPK